MMYRACLIALCLTATLRAHAQTPVTGTVLFGEAVPVSTVNQSALSKITFDMERCGALFRTRWRDRNGTLVAADELEASDGMLKRYRYARPNVSEWARVRREGDSLHIEHFEGGQLRRGMLPATRTTVVGPMIALLVEQHLERLRSGERLQVRYAVPDRLAAYDFTVSHTPSARAPLSQVDVTPDSWVIRKLTKPVSLLFSNDGRFVGMRGRALPAMGAPGHRQPLELDARVIKRESRKCSPDPQRMEWFGMDIEIDAELQD